MGVETVEFEHRREAFGKVEWSHQEKVGPGRVALTGGWDHESIWQGSPIPRWRLCHPSGRSRQPVSDTFEVQAPRLALVEKHQPLRGKS